MKIEIFTLKINIFGRIYIKDIEISHKNSTKKQKG